MKYKLIIFDFDGTLADTFTWFLTVADHLADKYRLKRLDRSQIETLRGLDIRQMLQHHKVPMWKLPIIARYLQKLLREDIEKVELFNGVDELIQNLARQNVLLAVLSSNSQHNIQQVLGAENTARIQYFECGVSLFGKSKKLKKLLEQTGISSSDALCIGDEVRDIQAARNLSIPFGAVSWGFTSIEVLKAHQPERIFSNVEDMAAQIS